MTKKEIRKEQIDNILNNIAALFLIIGIIAVSWVFQALIQLFVYAYY